MAASRGLTTASLNANALAFLRAVERNSGTKPVTPTPARPRRAPRVEPGARESVSAVGGELLCAVARGKLASGRAGLASTYEPRVGCRSADIRDVDRDRFTNYALRETSVPTPEPPVTGNKLICYTIQKGDTLSEIAGRYDTTVSELARLNDISNPNRIIAGETLYIRAPASHPNPCCDTYTVKRGDTLSEIAQRFATTGTFASWCAAEQH